MQGNGRGNSRSYSNLVDVEGVDDTPSVSGSAIPSVLGYSLVALSGGVAGFLLAGSVALGLATFAALIGGGVLGWLARGIAEGHER